MSRKDRLQDLLKNRHIWRPGDLHADARERLPSGFKQLDQHLGGGWSTGNLMELLLASSGLGELRLLMPALAELAQSKPAGKIAWIAPPYIPYAPALVQRGLDLSQILVIAPANQADGLWAMEQALRDSPCVAAFGWFTNIDDRAIRRLQLASQSSSCWAVIFRHARFARSASSAPLRIHVAPAQSSSHTVDLHILRNRYGSPGSLSVQC